MNSSLDKLVRNLSDEDFKYLVEEFGSENLRLSKQKGAYPYEYMSSFERFNEEKLPARKHFYSSTKYRKIGDDGNKSVCNINFKDYFTCEKVWDKFDSKNMGDYHDHYLKKDVLLLADVFQKFIETCLKFDGNDPCHYFSSPILSWHAMLKMTGVKLAKISDIDKYLFIEKELKGGTFYIAKRYAKANNKYMNNYDPKKPSKFITSFGMNNLYGWGLSEYLPYSGFKWLKNIDGFDANSISEKNPTGYFLEANLKYLYELYKLHNYYPLAPEKYVVRFL